jgi:hypothetical protein
VQPPSQWRTHTSSRGPEAARWAGVVIALAGATALHLARQRGVGAWESVWAEDGSVFLTNGYRDFAGTFFAQNGGYIHAVPRIIAGVAALFPAEDAAIVMAVAGSAVVAAISAFVYLASGAVLRSRSARLVLAATVLVLPVAGSELYANALNLHFYLLFACFWALFWQSETWAALGFRSTAALAATLSDPVSVLLLPLAIVAPVACRSLRAAAVSGFFLVGLATQLLLMRGGESPGRNWAFHLSDLPDIFSLRVAGGLLVGDRFLDDLWLAYGRAFSYAALVVVAAVIGLLLSLLLSRSDRPTAAFVLISLAYAGLFFCVQLFGRGTGGMDPEPGSFHLNGARYVLLPFLFVTAVVLVLVDRLGDSPVRDRWTWIRRAALVWLVAVVAANYLVGPNLRSSGPRWQHELEQARVSCGASTTGGARVLVAPAPPEVWFAEIPCDRLQSQRLERGREGRGEDRLRSRQ